MKPTSAQQTYADLYSLIDGSGRICDNEIKHRHYFRIAGITVCVESGLDFETVRFKNELLAFAVDGPGEDNITLRHHFFLPDLKGKDLGVEIYRKAPWVIYCKNGSWIYRGILPMVDEEAMHRVAIFSSDYTRALIYSPADTPELIRKSGFQSLSLLPTDQIWLAPLLADRNAVLLHAAAAIINGMGLIFVGHSDTGKTTTMEFLEEAKYNRGLDAEILCEDRNVIRRWPGCWYVHGTWSHGDMNHVYPAGAPLSRFFAHLMH